MGSCGLEVTVLASNANGPGFDPGQCRHFFSPNLFLRLLYLVYSFIFSLSDSFSDFLSSLSSYLLFLCLLCSSSLIPCLLLLFLSLNHTPDLRVGKIQHLVFSDKDEKSRRSRVHVAHVKDPLVVENRKE